MKIIQVVKQLNNTELGKSNTNDSYVLIPNELDVTDIFEREKIGYAFEDRDTGMTVVVRNTVEREKRLVGLGEYYRQKGLSAGDEIIFEKRKSDAYTEYLISVIKHNNCITFKHSRYGFEILRPDSIGEIEAMIFSEEVNIKILLLENRKKRSDSPEKTEFYDLILDGRSLHDTYTGKTYGMMFFNNGMVTIEDNFGWKKYEFEV